MSTQSLSPANFLDQTQQKGLVMAVFGLVFSKLAMLVISPDPLPFIKDTPVNIRGDCDQRLSLEQMGWNFCFTKSP